jgi:transposase
MRDWLPVDHVVWMVLDTVAQLDLSGLRSRYALGGVGRRAYDPEMLLALLIYAYADGIRSSRQIERLASTDIAMRVICGSQVPDHTVIARFRKLHEDSMRDLFLQVLLVCAQAGLGRLGTIAIDGTKIAANASRSASCRRQWLQQQVDLINAEASAADDVEDAWSATAEDDRRGPEQSTFHHDRRERIKRALAEVIAEEAESGLDAAAVAAKEREFLERTRRGANNVGSRPAGADPVAIAEARLSAAQTRLAEQIALKREKITAMRARLADYEAGIGPKPNLGPFSFDDQRGQDVARAKRWVRRAERELDTARHTRDTDATTSDERTVPGGGRRGPRSRTAKEPQPVVRRNVTDVDSRLMRNADGGSLQGYNAQLAVSADGLILHQQLVQDANDRRQLQPMTRAAVRAACLVHRARCTRRCPTTHGCCLEADLQHIDASDEAEPVVLSCAQPDCPCHTDWIGTMLFDNGYWSETNLNAPGPDRLIATGNKRSLPTPSADSPPLPDNADAETRMTHRLATTEGANLYKRRAATVEPVNGHLKDRIGLRRFARRGLNACQAELELAVLVLNLRKLWQTRLPGKANRHAA